uniref:Uncharacterized protein n=1 Tax=Pyramimonas orientalis virus TaxID=455367 RepID=A0A7L9AXP7_POV01|nr:hypothetical protein HWQ62_00242 [Pyramimonas orientalis virus]
MLEEFQNAYEKLKSLTLIKNYKIVSGNTKEISKKDLMHYLVFLREVFPNIYQNQNHVFDKFLKKTQRKTKGEIIQLINYYLDTRNTNETFEAVIKGTKYPELVKVYVKKEVHKVV